MLESPMVRRVAAVEATLARFNGKPFVWGETDCARLAAHTLRGLDVRVSLLKTGRYSTALGAAKALKRLGFGGIDEALDAMGLARIAPAMVLPGDIVGLPAEGSEIALTVAVGNQRVLGFMDGRCGVLQPSHFSTAWRAI